MTTARSRAIALLDDMTGHAYQQSCTAFVDAVLSAAEGRTQKTSETDPVHVVPIPPPGNLQPPGGSGDGGTDSDALKLARLLSLDAAPYSDRDVRKLAREVVRLHERATLCAVCTDMICPAAPASSLATNVMSPDETSVLGKLVPPSAFAAAPASSDGRPDREALGRATFAAWCAMGCPLRQSNDNDRAAWRYVGERLYEMGRKDGEARATLVADGDETDAGIARYMAAEARQKAEEGRRWPDVFVLFDAVFAERPVDVRVANDGLDANEVRYVPAARAEKAERERDESYARGNAPATTYRQRAESASRERDAAVARAEAAERRWRPEVVAFADAMERELRENDHKGGWQDDSATSLVKRVIEETTELAREVKRPHEWATPEHWQVRVLSEAADVANFAMMVADVCGALPLRPAAPTADDGDEKERDEAHECAHGNVTAECKQCESKCRAYNSCRCER